MSKPAKPQGSGVYVPRYYNPFAAARAPQPAERVQHIQFVALRKLKRELLARGIEKGDLIG